jgi:hypothetical protein
MVGLEELSPGAIGQLTGGESQQGALEGQRVRLTSRMAATEGFEEVIDLRRRGFRERKGLLVGRGSSPQPQQLGTAKPFSRCNCPTPSTGRTAPRGGRATSGAVSTLAGPSEARVSRAGNRQARPMLSGQIGPG